jgi:hypothetical protein
MTGETLASVSQWMVTRIQQDDQFNNTCLSILPVMLHTIRESYTVIHVNHSEEVVSSIKLCDYLITSLLEADWKRHHIISFMIMFREMILTEKQSNLLFQKILV